MPMVVDELEEVRVRELDGGTERKSQPPIAMLVLHCIKDHIYAIHLSWFDLRVQDASRALYISACTPLSGRPYI